MDKQLNPAPSVPRMVGGQCCEDNQEDEDDMPTSVADEPVKREVQVDLASACVTGKPVVTAVKVPGDVKDLVHHRVERRQQRLQDEVGEPEHESHVRPPAAVKLVPDHLGGDSIVGSPPRIEFHQRVER